MGAKRIIVGIDPGTTAAFAALNLKGEVISVFSSKNFGVNEFISEITKVGKPLVIGTDKAKIPSLVSEVAVKMGARLISPRNDLKVEEKKEFSENTKNDHESDSLAAATFAYNRIKTSIIRVVNGARRIKKEHHVNLLLDYVIVKGISFSEAVSIIENNNKEEKRILTKVVEEDKLHRKDFLRLSEKISLYKKENSNLKRKNIELKKKIALLEKQVKEKPKKKVVSKNIKKTLNFKDQSITFLKKTLEQKNKLVEEKEGDTRELQSIISRMNNLFILKKLDTFKKDEFLSKEKLLNISSKDVLYIKNPNIMSDFVVSRLKGLISIIIVDGKVNSVVSDYFTVIDSNDLEIEEYDYFGLVDKRELREAIDRKQNFLNIVEEYQKERSHNLLKSD